MNPDGSDNNSRIVSIKHFSAMTGRNEFYCLDERNIKDPIQYYYDSRPNVSAYIVKFFYGNAIIDLSFSSSLDAEEFYAYVVKVARFNLSKEEKLDYMEIETETFRSKNKDNNVISVKQ